MRGEDVNRVVSMACDDSKDDPTIGYDPAGDIKNVSGIVLATKFRGEEKEPLQFSGGEQRLSFFTGIDSGEVQGFGFHGPSVAALKRSEARN